MAFRTAMVVAGDVCMATGELAFRTAMVVYRDVYLEAG